MRHSNRCAVFGTTTLIEFDYECVKDQVPDFWKGNKITRGSVVAVDYRTKKVTVNCGSILHYDPEKKTFWNLCIKDVHVPIDYESERDDEPGFDHGYNSDA